MTPKPAPPSSTALPFVAPGAPDAHAVLAALKSELAEARRLLLVERAIRHHDLPADWIGFLTGVDEAAIESQAAILAAHARRHI
ncbi:hypothetical protein J7E29_02460 [Streptomyces sp. ISL-90]|nr:hypothetical protein [Streptomyces sp. ISL-90]